jgi:hypothetical protein
VSNSKSPHNKISLKDPAGYRLIAMWAAVILVVSLLSGYFMVSKLHQHRLDAMAEYAQRMDPRVVDPNQTGIDMSLSHGARPVDVHIGVYVDRIVDLSIENDAWTADFYIWFNWTDSSLSPGESFQVVDGHIESKQELDTYVKGDQHYALYRVVARITKFFDVSHFPADDQLLTIQIESRDSKHDQLRYVADRGGSSVSSRVIIPDYEIYDKAAAVKDHFYRTARGDPRLPPGSVSIYSQFRYGIWLRRADWEFYIKIFMGLFAAVVISLLAFFVKPARMDARYVLGVGAFFGAIASSISTASLVPDTSTFTLTDMVSSVGLVTIFLSVVESTICLHIYHTRGEESLAPLFDKVSFAILMTSYIAINLAIPLAATS